MTYGICSICREAADNKKVPVIFLDVTRLLRATAATTVVYDDGLGMSAVAVAVVVPTLHVVTKTRPSTEGTQMNQIDTRHDHPG